MTMVKANSATKSANRNEDSLIRIFLAVVPWEGSPAHRDIYSRFQQLDRADRRIEVEDGIRPFQGIGSYRSGGDDGLIDIFLGNDPSGLPALFFGHVKTVNRQRPFKVNGQRASSLPKNPRKLTLPKRQFTLDSIILLIKCPTGSDDSQILCHSILPEDSIALRGGDWATGNKKSVVDKKIW